MIIYKMHVLFFKKILIILELLGGRMCSTPLKVTILKEKTKNKIRMMYSIYMYLDWRFKDLHHFPPGVGLDPIGGM